MTNLGGPSMGEAHAPLNWLYTQVNNLPFFLKRKFQNQAFPCLPQMSELLTAYNTGALSLSTHIASL